GRRLRQPHRVRLDVQRLCHARAARRRAREDDRERGEGSGAGLVQLARQRRLRHLRAGGDAGALRRPRAPADSAAERNGGGARVLVPPPAAALALWAAARLSPVVVPGVAAGLGFLGLAAGLGLLASRWVLFAVHVSLVLPFVIRSVSASVANPDPALVRAAAS